MGRSGDTKAQALLWGYDPEKEFLKKFDGECSTTFSVKRFADSAN